MNYLLYIDILGFADIVKNNRAKVDILYDIIDDLNAHKHGAFKVIIFSDTVLVFPDFNCEKADDHRYATMYLIEFTQDLFYRTSRKEIFFRAVIDYDHFTYIPLKNCEKYFGEALIQCYEHEKKINCIGTFITNRAANHQSIFPMARFSEELQFVYFQQYYCSFFREFGGGDVVSWDLVYGSDYEFPMVREMMIFKILQKNARTHPDPRVRVKFIQYLEYYKKQYPWPLRIWESKGFSMSAVVPERKWMSTYREVAQEE